MNPRFRVLPPALIPVLALLLAVAPLRAQSEAAESGRDALPRFDANGLLLHGAQVGPSSARPSGDAAYAATSVAFTPNLTVNDVATNQKNFLPNAELLNDGSFALAWSSAENYTGTGEEVRFTRSFDQGDSWQPSVRIVHRDETGQVAVLYASLAQLADDTLGVLFSGLIWNGLTYKNQLHFRRSLDGGASWSDSVLLPMPSELNGNRGGYKNQLIGVGDVFIVTYSDTNQETWSTRSSDAGASWEPIVLVTPAPSDTNYVTSSLSWDAVHGKLLTIYDVGDQLFSISSDDLGLSWNVPVAVSTLGALHTDFPDLTVGANGVAYAAWNQRAADTDVYVAVSSDGGDSWSTPLQVDDGTPTGNQYEPHLLVDAAGTAHIGWIWNTPGESDIDLYYSRSSDDGATWMTPQPRVNDVPEVVAPYVAYTFELLGTDDGGACFFFQDNRVGIGYRSVMFSKSVDSEPWVDLGDGLAGTGGVVPQLAGTGPLTAGSPTALELSDALPGSTTNLVIGLSLLGVTFKGGVLVPSPDVIVAGLPLDGVGALTLSFAWPMGAAPGTQVWFQHWVQDPAGPLGFAASNGLRAEGQ